jgi:beta-lactamase superfamily II metal-dependent hydrolase
MLRLHVVQAEFGDSLILEYGTPGTPRFILIDGGPAGTYENHLRAVLAEIPPRARTLDMAVLSHVDTDHITGLLDYFSELQSRPTDLPLPARLWHNAFADAVDTDNEIAPRLRSLMTAARSATMPATAFAVNGIGEGRALRARAVAAGIEVNPDIPGGLISVDGMRDPIELGNLTLRVAGPTKANLAALKQEWIAWLEKHEDEIQSDRVMVLANSDRSVPNLSSIMLLAVAEGKTILLTGDGRSDHLLDGLKSGGLLDQNGKLHVDVFKLPHHGSDRNVTKKLFQTITADIYVASANGRDGNPDLATLIWIAEAAKAQGRAIELVVTNRTPSVIKLVEEYPADEYGYKLTVLGNGKHAHLIELAA